MTSSITKKRILSGLQRLTGRKSTLFPGSSAYWKSRYSAGGNSGAGSYGPLAEFKAAVLNDFVRRERVSSLIEFGCGDGHQLSLADYPRYLGIDPARTAVEMCVKRFADDRSKSFFWLTPGAYVDPAGFLQAEAALSLDVIYHLVEDAVFDDYMRSLFAAATRFVVIYSSDTDAPPSGVSAPHVRHRRFSDWVEAHAAGWEVRETIANRHPYVPGDPNTSIAGFTIYARASA